MNRYWASAAIVVFGVAACGDDTTDNAVDMGTTPDSAVVEQDAAAGDDAAVAVDAALVDAAVAIDAATPTDASSPIDATTTADAAAAAGWADVHAEFRSSCTPCHSTNGSGGHNMAQTNASSAYDDSQESSGVCTGLTKGACAAARVRAGSMPPGGGLSLSERTRVADIIDSWVAGGQLAP